jgi:SAM-dependent methyltransferase
MRLASTAADGQALDGVYTRGDYFDNPQRHGEDAEFKASQFLTLLGRTVAASGSRLDSYVDVGCGSGDVVRLVAKGLRDAGFAVRVSTGYDISPHVERLVAQDGLEFVNGDFSEADAFVDLVTLFDVVEHVPDPINFLKRISERCRIIGLHLPLDNSFNAAFRDLFRAKVKNPGHLIFLDVVSALNLLAMAGLRVTDYEYTHAFAAPSGRSSVLARLANPLRALLAKVSPWLLSKTLGGASLMVIAVTPAGLRSNVLPGRIDS